MSNNLGHLLGIGAGIGSLYWGLIAQFGYNGFLIGSGLLLLLASMTGHSP